MKRHLTFIVILLIAGFLFASCINEVSHLQDLKRDKVFHAVIPSSSSSEDTKTYLSEDLSQYWYSEDIISVFRSTTNEKYQFAGSTGEIKNKFHKIDESEVGIPFSKNYALYPYSSTAESTTEGTIGTSLPAIQTYAEDSFGQDANTMVAVTDTYDDDTFFFKNVCGFLRLRLYGGDSIKSICLYGNNGEKIAGSASISLDNRLEPSIEMSPGATESITLYCGESGVPTPKSEDDAVCFWIVLPPTHFTKGFTVEITDAYDNVRIQKTNKDTEFKRNTIKTMKAVRCDSNSMDILSFALSDGTDIYSAFEIRDSVISVHIPNGTDASNMKAVFTHDGASVKVGGVEQTSGISEQDFSDFVNPVRYVVTSTNGFTHEYKIMVYDIPVLIINTPTRKPITSKTVRVEGCELKAIDNSGEITDLGTAGIKVRGNSTAGMPKKPYNIKLDSKTRMFGLGTEKSKHWIMLANCFYDRTQLHNAVAYRFAKMTDYPWVQDGTFCDLILNGELIGLYYICEKVRIEKGRIELTEMDTGDTSPESLTGAYLMETTIFPSSEASTPYFSTDYYNFSNGYTYYWCFDNPEENIRQEHIDYIKGRLNNLATLIHEQETTPSNAYLDYLDIETMIDWFLVEEVCQNEEASRSKNVWIYKNRNDEKFYIGPPWDFDAWSFGYTNYKRWLTKDNSLFLPGLFKNATFAKRVKDKWAVYKQMWLTDGLDYFDQQREFINNSALRNDDIWTKRKGWVSGYTSKSYEEYVNDMRAAIQWRINWIDSHMNEIVINYDNKYGGNEDVNGQDDRTDAFDFK